MGGARGAGFLLRERGLIGGHNRGGGPDGVVVAPPGRLFLICYWVLASVPIRGLESRRAKESAKESATSQMATMAA